MCELSMEHNNCVLLTGTIDSGKFHNVGNRIIDINERLDQYVNSIYSYIVDSAFNVIVFGENSGYAFDESVFVELAHKHGKEFEYVRCNSYVDETIKRGKSYGEARLISEALQTSRLLANENTIYKCTGRIYLKNSHQICNTKNKHQNEFIVYQNKNWCFTNLFKFSKSDYQKYWINAYEKCNEREGKDIERVFFDILTSVKELDIGSFSVWPYFDGIQGSTLEAYTGGMIERVLRTIMCKLGFFSYGTFTSKLMRF